MCIRDRLFTITWKFAVTLVFEFRVTLSGLSLEPSDQPLKLYPSLGVAVILTCVPLEKVPPGVDTLPPSPADTVRVYCFVISDGGVFGFCESSFAQVRSNVKLKYMGSLFIG